MKFDLSIYWFGLFDGFQFCTDDRQSADIFCYLISIDNRIKLIEEFRKADVVILTYACDQPATLDRLSSYWLPELRRLQVSQRLLFYAFSVTNFKFSLVTVYVYMCLRSKHQ